jgi:hypothetical protein
MGAEHTLKTLKKYPDVTRFQNAELMSDKLGSQIDAVMVGTPDFSHFPNAIPAMKLGKHIYVEKPITLKCRRVLRTTSRIFCSQRRDKRNVARPSLWPVRCARPWPWESSRNA